MVEVARQRTLDHSASLRGHPQRTGTTAVTVSARTGRDTETGELVCPITVEIPIRERGDSLHGDMLRGWDYYAFPSWAAAAKWMRSKDFPTHVEEITFRDRRV
jgi:hypothetical protein